MEKSNDSSEAVSRIQKEIEAHLKQIDESTALLAMMTKSFIEITSHLSDEERTTATSMLLGGYSVRIRQFADLRLEPLSLYLNDHVRGDVLMSPDEEDPEMKKVIAGKVNDFLRFHDVSIRHPHNHEHCIVLAVGSPDKLGRYVLESKITKKRTMTCKTITKVMPFVLLANPKTRYSGKNNY